MRQGADQRERHYRLAARRLEQGGSRGANRAMAGSPEHAERAAPRHGVDAGLRAEQAELREDAGAPQLGAEALSRARAELSDRDPLHRRRREVDHSRANARLAT